MSYTYVADCKECNVKGVIRVKLFNNSTYINPPIGWMMSVEKTYLCVDCAGAIDPQDCEDVTPITYPER